MEIDFNNTSKSKKLEVYIWRIFIFIFKVLRFLFKNPFSYNMNPDLGQTNILWREYGRRKIQA